MALNTKRVEGEEGEDKSGDKSHDGPKPRRELASKMQPNECRDKGPGPDRKCVEKNGFLSGTKTDSNTQGIKARRK